MIAVVDTAEHVEAALPKLDEMVGGGLMTVERVEVIAHRPGTLPPS